MKQQGAVVNPRLDPQHDSFARGLLLGILAGEGHFGGDGRQPQLTLKMHVRREPLLRHLMTICPGGKLYGPYHHGQRHYLQLMFRGPALRDSMLPLLDALPWPSIDPDSYARYESMKARYARFLGLPAAPEATELR